NFWSRPMFNWKLFTPNLLPSHKLAQAAAQLGTVACAAAFSWGAAHAAQTTADTELPPDVIKAAQAEGGLMLYSSSDQNQSRRLLAAFEKKYGIKGEFIRFP